MNTEFTEQPFNLETALKHPEWVYFRNGEKPLEWHWFEKSTSIYTIVAINAGGGHHSIKKDGVCFSLDGMGKTDLILRVPYYNRWICLYPSKYTLHDTKEEAEKDADVFVLFILPVKIPATI
jgi:hypothetical protein